jgi:predicted transporter
MNKFIGIIIIVGTIIGQFYLTKLYGSNFFPKSPAELGTDILALMLVGLGIYILRSKRKLL